MYIVTFYSFKGGVGRTLALANVAYELANKGKKVLIVDFDLEAPGLHTFKAFQQPEPHLGILDFINDYLGTGASPDVREYIYEVLGVGKKDGHLWVMPAGKSDGSYQDNYSRINWSQLYKEHDGYILLEDIKAQWEKAYDFDYVLIDSRTGHTDIGGICTRQLPNAVVLLFFPNDQNLYGLQPIVSAIREYDNEVKKETTLHFVMSNVPDLDDEEEILSSFENRFKQELDYTHLTSTIHRYDSMSLLDQSLFVAERPRSRLAKEYKKLMETIAEYNIEDREGILRKINQKHTLRLLNDDKSLSNEEKYIDYIDNIIKKHSKDGELLYILAKHLRDLGLSKRSDILIQRSINTGYRSPDSFLSQADIREKENELDEAINNVFQAFSFDDLNPEQLGRGIGILRRIQPEKLLDIIGTKAFNTLSPDKCTWLAHELDWCMPGLKALVELLLRHYKNDGLSQRTHNSIKSSLLLSYVGLSEFKKAINLFGSTRPNPDDLSMQNAFNYGMAEWGLYQSPSKDMFARVTAGLETLTGCANICQCLSVAYWVLGDSIRARELLSNALEAISENPNTEFSCWRYMSVIPNDFKKDCLEIEQLIDGRDIKPRFIRFQTILPIDEEN